MENKATDLTKAIQDFQSGKEEAFAEIYRQTKKYVYYTIYKSLQDASLTEDIMQETYLEVYRSLSGLKNEEAVKSWIASIAHRRISRYLEKKPDYLLGEETEEIIEKLEQKDGTAIPEEVTDNLETRRLLGKIIDGLPLGQRTVIVAYYYNQMSVREIAENFQMPENTVKSYLSRGREKIKEDVLRLEKEQGTKLYTISLPAILFFLFGEEAQACEVPETLSEKILQAVPSDTGSTGRAANATDRGNEAAGQIAGAAGRENDAAAQGAATAVKAAAGKAGAGLIVKLCLAAAGIAAAVGVAFGVYRAVQSHNAAAEASEEAASAMDETGTQVAAQETQQAQAAAGPGAEEETASETDTETETETETQEEQYRYLIEMTALMEMQKDSSLNARCGVMPICRDGLWGAVNYEGELIVPCTYEGVQMAPNDLGQFIMNDAGKQYAFDKEGTLLFEAEQITSLYGDYVTTKESTGEYDELGDEIYRGTIGKLDGTVLAQMETSDWDFGVVGFGDSDVTFMGAFEHLVRVDKNGNTQGFDPVYQASVDEEGSRVQSSAASVSFYNAPGGLYLDGYYVSTWAIMEEFCLMKDERAFDSVNPRIVAEEVWGDSRADTEVTEMRRASIFHHGGWSYNYGTKVGLLYYDKDSGESLGSILMDLAKDTDPYSSAGSECVLGVYDDLSMNMEKYWLVKTEGKWGYIDHEGNLQELYEEASSFANGYAVVIEDGTAWLIDESFTRLEEIGPADGCFTAGELFCVSNGEEQKLFGIK